MPQNKRVLVIGGGFSGLGSVKCLKEVGYEPVCYEKTSEAGGTWYYRKESPVGLPSIMPTTIINHSKEMGALSNCHPDKKFPNYMRHYELLELFHDFGKKFDCFKHFVFNREVIHIKRSADYEDTGRWNVTVKNTITEEVMEEVFDAIWVGVGHITYPKMTDFPGMEKFQGTIMHTHSLKTVEAFKNQKALVIGMGCSGLDAAVEISNVASQVYLSSRSGAWILPRVGVHGLPFDYICIRRFVNAIQRVFGVRYASRYLESSQINTRYNHNLYNIRPEYPALFKDPAVNDFLPAKLLTGTILLKKNVKCFTEKGVIFENESHVTEVDVVIMATGYKWQFPFLEEGIVKSDKEGRINLYKCVFPNQLKHPTLAFVGFILPFGPGFPLGEMQCRWAAQILKGNCKLPPPEVMIEETEKRYEKNVQRFAPSDKMAIRVDYIEYLDDLAVEIGAKPNMWKMFFTDFTLWQALFFGPSLPYQYRLQGPYPWSEARQAILTSHERVRYPFSGDFKKRKKPVPTGKYLKYVIAFLLLAFWITQSETSLKCYLVTLLFPYFLSWSGFYKKYFFSLLMLPFFVTWEGFVSSYFVTLFFPLILAYLPVV